jgi:hypothetical protein
MLKGSFTGCQTEKGHALARHMCDVNSGPIFVAGRCQVGKSRHSETFADKFGVDGPVLEAVVNSMGAIGGGEYERSKLVPDVTLSGNLLTLSRRILLGRAKRLVTNMASSLSRSDS